MNHNLLYAFHSQQQAYLMCFQGRTPQETMATIMKKIMTKGLAEKFSLTGMGEKRQPSKISFKAHPLAEIVLGEGILITYPFIFLCITYLKPGLTPK